MERVILHCDANAFYASVECLYTPSIRHRPVAVCGSVEERHGIVLTKNQIAKQFGVQTGEAIWQARQKCPDLICVPPDYGLYIRFSKRMRRIYEEYSDRVESFGLDEAWIDLSNPGLTIRDGERIAHEIRLRVKRELGITVSVGVSFNKIFAKLGSDMKKPDAVTVIPADSFREKVWPLPVGDLLFVGPATRRKLADMNVRTIGDLARFDAECLRGRLGKPGLVLKAYAAGLDRHAGRCANGHPVRGQQRYPAARSPNPRGCALSVLSAGRIRGGAAASGRAAGPVREHQRAQRRTGDPLLPADAAASHQPDGGDCAGSRAAL